MHSAPLVNKRKRKDLASRIKGLRRSDRGGEARYNRNSGIKKYSAVFGFDLKKHINTLMKKRGYLKVMDLGCGNGVFLTELKTLFGKKVKTHGFGLTNPKNKNIDKMHVGSYIGYNFSEPFDLIVSSGSIQHSRNVGFAIQKAANILLFNGQAILDLGKHHAEGFYAKEYVKALNESGYKAKLIGTCLHIKRPVNAVLSGKRFRELLELAKK